MSPVCRYARLLLLLSAEDLRPSPPPPPSSLRRTYAPRARSLFALLQEDRRAAKKVLAVKGGLKAMEANFPFLVKGNDAFSDAEYVTPLLLF